MTTEHLTERELAWQRFPNDAFTINTNMRPGRCRSAKCQAPVWWGTTVRGKQCPFDIKPNGEYTGTSHWRTCLDRERFQR